MFREFIQSGTKSTSESPKIVSIGKELLSQEDRNQEVEQRAQEADALDMQPQPPGGYDAETLRYKVAVEKLDLPADVVDDLVEMFQSNDAPFRETLWERVKKSPLNQQ